MSNPFFSIIIPTYNRANLILKTIESVRSQTFKDYEIIVVDNCSTDRTIELLSPLERSGEIKLIVHDRNYERAVSRNTGMRNASGRFVTFLDSDDILYPTLLQVASDFAKGHPELKFFQSKYELINEEGNSLYQFRFPPVTEASSAIMAGNFVSCIAFFLEEEIYRNYEFDTTEVLQGIEDWEFAMRILARFRMGRIPHVLAGIVHHGNRSTTQYQLHEYLDKMRFVIAKFSEDPGLKRFYGRHFGRFRRSCYLLIASHANTGGLFGVARSYLLMAWKENPLAVFNLRFLRIAQISIMKIKSKI